MAEADVGRLAKAGRRKGGDIQKFSLIETMANRRQHLSDITNSTNRLQRNSRSGSGHENLDMASFQKTKCYIAKLLKENTELIKRLGEKSKCIELNNLELQKLRNSVQQLQQQNCQLARTNTLMLEELNLGKDKLRAMQHELRCTAAALKCAKLELEDKRKLTAEDAGQTINLKNEMNAVEHFHPARKAAHYSPKRRASRNRSRGSAPVASEKEIAGNGGTASVSSDSSLPLLKEKDHPDGKEEGSPKRKRASRSCSLESELLVREAPVKKNTAIGNLGRRNSRTSRKSEACEQKEGQISQSNDHLSSSKTSENLQRVDAVINLSTSTSPIVEMKVCDPPPDPSDQEHTRRSVSGRPQRRSTVGVSYKEKSLVVKMRRP